MLNISKSLVIALLFASNTIGAFKYDIKEGGCPYAPGTIEANISVKFDHQDLIGPWINIFDRVELN